MPPQDATGFRYTPTSYLQQRAASMNSSTGNRSKARSASMSSASASASARSKSIREENRPWTGDEATQELEATTALRQEDRPSRKHSTIDANFQSRIQKRKDLYRGILNGRLEVVPSDYVDELDPLEHSLSVLESSSHSISHSISNKDEERIVPSMSSQMAEQARQARQRRLSGKSQVIVSNGGNGTANGNGNGFDGALSKADQEAFRVRNLRAQRLRSAKKVSLAEDDYTDTLAKRRIQQLEHERLERAAQKAADSERWQTQVRLDAERVALAEERKALESAKRQAQRDLHYHESTKRRPPSPSSLDGNPNRKTLRIHRAPSTEGDDTTEHLDTSLWEEVRLLLRDSGVLRTCVTSCFGDEDDLRQDASKLGGSSNRKGNRNRNYNESLVDIELSDESDTVVQM